MRIRVPGRTGKKRQFFRNYVAAMAELCEENSDDDWVGLWLKIYAFMVLSGVLFPRTPYGGTYYTVRKTSTQWESMRGRRPYGVHWWRQ